MTVILWPILGYLLGSIPFAYLAGLLVKGQDIRRRGTRSLGGSNVYVQVSKLAAAVVGLLDVSKAALPAWLALHAGAGMAVAMAAGLAAIAGHNWSLYLGFYGGRGIGASLGVLLATFLPGFAWILTALLIGAALQNSIVLIVGFATLAPLALVTGYPPAVAWAALAMLALVIIKRIEANREPLPSGPERWAVLRRRILLDRDIDDWDAWVSRRVDD